MEPRTAAALGFPNLDYAVVERERRWLCRRLPPQEQVARSERITDLYITGSRLRLREARRSDGKTAMLRLTRKADVDARTRLVTSIYLSEEEFGLLASLPGRRLEKLRHRLHSPPGLLLSVDEFQGRLEGLILLEVDFATAEPMSGFEPPPFAGSEVTDDARYSGGHLAMHGVPRD